MLIIMFDLKSCVCSVYTHYILLISVHIKLMLLDRMGSKNSFQMKVLVVTACAKKMLLVHHVLKQFLMALSLSDHVIQANQSVALFQMCLVIVLMKTHG